MTVRSRQDFYKWATQRARYMTLETIGSVSDNPTVSLPAVAG